MDSGLREVKVHVIHNPRNPRMHPTVPPNQSPQIDIEKRPMSNVSSRCNHVYVNNAFTGSVNSVNANIRTAPPTSVIREQYWTCSKWSNGKRVLAIAVGVLGGAVIGLAISLGLLGKDGPHLGGFLLQHFD